MRNLFWIYCLIAFLPSTQGFSQSSPERLVEGQRFTWHTFKAYPNDSLVSCEALATIYTRHEEDRLFFTIRWADDLQDTRAISPDERRWKDPEGVRRDKDLMYFYDNLGIRLFFGDYFYEGWIRPAFDSIAVQWENFGTISNRASQPIQLVETKTSGRSADELIFELALPLEALDWPLEEKLTLKVTLIVVDADHPIEQNMKQRLRKACFCVATQSFQLVNQK